MKSEQLPGTHQFVFELTLGINSALTLSSGELSTLVLDGLFALEEQDMLFPGITEPRDRLRMARMNAIGYERSGLSTPRGAAYELLMSRLGRLSKGKLKLKERLDTGGDGQS